jgi:hypothetical protein
MRSAVLFVLVITWNFAHADTTPPPAAAPAAPSIPGCPTAALDAALTKAKPGPSALPALAATTDRLIARAPNDACRWALFNAYWDRYGAVQQKLAERCDRTEDTTKLMRPVAPLGWTYRRSEAGGMVGDGNMWLLDHAGAHLTPAQRAYLTLRLRDDAEDFIEDEGLLITWKQLRERVRRWEDFDRRHPDFVEHEQVEQAATVYLRYLLIGGDNTPTFDRESDTLLPEVRVELEAYIADPHARRADSVRSWYAMVKRNGFKHSDEATEYLAGQGLTFHP